MGSQSYQAIFGMPLLSPKLKMIFGCMRNTVFVANIKRLVLPFSINHRQIFRGFIVRSLTGLDLRKFKAVLLILRRS